jgi:hypothetical protein
MGTGVISRGKIVQRVKMITPASSADAKKEWSFTSTPPICLHVVNKDKYTFFNFYSFFYKFSLRVNMFKGI